MNIIKRIGRKIPAVRSTHYSRMAKDILNKTAIFAGRLIEQGCQFDAAASHSTLTPSKFGLPELGEKYRPSKRVHNYLARYDHVFGASRHQVKRMVEIGVQTDTSVRMWSEYFPNAEIVGIDIDPECKRFENDRIKIVIGDQTDPVFLSQFARDYFGTVDIIVDDGLHSPEAIQASFEYLYPALATHGIYAIEDLVNHKYVPALVSEITAAINYWPSSVNTKRWPILDDLGKDAGWFAHNTIGVEFYRHILFVKRGLNPRDNPHFLNKALFFDSYNKGLNEVAAARLKLVADGRAVTEDNLVEIVGFQKRYYVEDYLAGMRKFELDERTNTYKLVS